MRSSCRPDSSRAATPATVDAPRRRRRTTSSVASSAQCRSSSTSTVGTADPQLLEQCDRCIWWAGRRSTRSRSSPPVTRATSSNGPSGRGVRSGSQPPHRIRARSRPELAEAAQKRRLARARFAAHPAPAARRVRPDTRQKPTQRGHALISLEQRTIDRPHELSPRGAASRCSWPSLTHLPVPPRKAPAGDCVPSPAGGALSLRRGDADDASRSCPTRPAPSSTTAPAAPIPGVAPSKRPDEVAAI